MRGGRIVRNFGTLTSVKVASDLCTFAFFVVLSRVYGQEGLGHYSFAMALTGFFALFGDFGLYNLTVLEVSRRRDSVEAYFGQVLLLRLLLCAASFGGLLLVLPWLPVSREGAVVVVLIGVYQFAYRITNGFVSLFVASERMGVVSLFEFSLRLATALGGISISLLGGSLVLAVAVLPIATCAEIAVAAALARRHYGAPRLRGAAGALRETLRRATPFGLSGLLFQLQSRAVILLLGLLAGVEAAGVYNAAYRVVFLLSFLTYYAGFALFPAASRLYRESREQLRGLYRDALRAFVLLGVPATAGLALLAPELIELVFGSSFHESKAVLRWLSALLLLNGVRNLLGFFLMACDAQVGRVVNQWVSALVNLGLLLLLIPRLGVQGAAATVVGAELLLVGLHLWRLRAPLGWPPVGSALLAAAGASACFAVPIAWLGPLPLPLAVGAAVPIYVAALWAFPEVRRGELELVLRWLRGRWARSGAVAGASEG